MSAPQAVLDLIEHFERELDAFKSGKYNEAQLRHQFLDPLFKALGWDMYNESKYAEAYKDVIHEDALRIGTGTKAPDYCFRIGGARKFFLEAKKPSVFIKEELPPAYQLRRYAWTAKLPLSVLSDFEEFAIYDCRIRPNKTDKASTARIFYCTYRELPEKWDYIASIFSKEAVLKGSFDRYAIENKAKRGTAEVDAAFLKEIERWREDLARNLALRNAKLGERELNFAVQRIIDRIIFLRIAEDRGLETYGRLQALTDGPRIYPRLCELFEAADARYNSGLFHFKKESGRHEAPDELTLELDIDDKLLKDILKNLYYPDSPYAFSVLSADILGQVYEQFLGKVITLTEGHRAKVDDKPEVKKAGGVYYTPTYIVDYIVRETVGKLLEECSSRRESAHSSSAEADRSGLTSAATRDKVDTRAATAVLNRVASLRILDPACGSGSFLIGAYQFLLDWHLDFYTTNDPARWAKEITRAKKSGVKLDKAKHPVLVQTRAGEWQLSIAERKRILLDNIYGVDIDGQAVEVTKLSLLLKVLEGEAGLAQMTLGLADRVLPDLGDNIKCGNSLIGPDFYEQPELAALTEEERYRINVFDWQKEFPTVFGRSRGDETQTGSGREDRDSSRRLLRGQEDAGGFDAVIGNPPYVRVQLLAHHEIDFYFRSYTSAASKIDLSVFFLEKSLALVSARGLVGLITTKQWLTTDYGVPIRRLLADGRIKQMLDFGSLPVFVNADTYPAILICNRMGNNSMAYGEVTSRQSLNIEALIRVKLRLVSLNELGSAAWNLSGFDLPKLCQVRGVSLKPLSFFGHVYIGDLTGMDEAFVLKAEDLDKQSLKSELVFPYAYRGAEVARYCDVNPTSLVIYPYEEGPDGAPVLISETDLKSRVPKLFPHLLALKAKLRERMDSRRLYASEQWYRHLRPGNFSHIRPAKLIFKGIDTRLSVGLLGENCVFNGANTPAFIPEELGATSLLYLLGVLNSRLIGFYLSKICPPKLGGYTRFNATNINETPIRVIDFESKEDKSRHERMIQLVDHMLGLNRQRATAGTPQEQTALDRQIESTDAQIDRLVYELYGLTEDEIRIVEGAEPVAEQSAVAAPEPVTPTALPPGQSAPQSEADAAHFYSAKEDPMPYRTENDGNPKGD